MLGIRAWESGQAYMWHRNLAEEARTTMRSIVDALNETAQLAILDGVDTVYLARIDCSHPVRLASRVGMRLPAYATGLGKALLANLEPEELTARLRNSTLTAFTAHTITSVVVLLRELSAIRERGYALDNEEYTSGLRCVAVPIRDRHGHHTTAMSISIPLMRANREQLALALPLLAKGSLDVARRMGNTVDDMRLQRLIELPVEVDFGDTRPSMPQVVS